MAQIRTRVWLNPRDEFPEHALPELRARPSTGLCLSGGGTRSAVASIGYLRGLLELGLLDRLRYMSAVSGGSWALVPFCFWREGAADDSELLGGPLISPEQLDKEQLTADLPPSYLGTSATGAFAKGLFGDLREQGAGQSWVSNTAETFLRPWGLDQPEAPRSYTWSAASLDDILARQAELPGRGLGAEDFVVARPGRPFPIVSASLLGPAVGGLHAQLDPVGMQFTPLYVGSPPAQEATYTYKDGRELSRLVGGGLIEPFAFGGAGPGWLADDSVQVQTLERPAKLSDLAFAIGSSSCAYASLWVQGLKVPERVSGRVPTAKVWPLRAGDVPTSRTWEFGDGGIIDNYGLYALLQRKVETIIVLVNSVQKLSLDWTPDMGSYASRIDAFLPPLFGIREPNRSLALQRGQVFPTEEFADLLGALQASKRAGDPLVAVREHRVLDNEWWGIRGGRTVRVAWVYLDRVRRFEELLPEHTAKVIGVGNLRLGAGPFENFPNYKTIGANRRSLIRLEPAQIRLLAGLCTWSVLDRREVFEELLR
jgi:hypothetical protein